MRYTHSLITRVSIALLVLIVPTLLQINIFQAVFESLTLKAVIAILKIADVGAIAGSYGVRNAIDISGGYTIKIVKYCVTSSAYYLYTLLVILVYDVSIGKRITALLIGYAAIFAMNIVRILVLIIMLVENGQEYFAAAHDVMGTVLAIFYVLVLWFLMSIAMGIKNIPIISDVKILIREMLNKNEV